MPIILAIAIRQKKEIKLIQIRKEVKLFLLSDGMILPIRVPKDSITRALEVIDIFSKVIGGKINTQSQQSFYISMKKTLSEKSEKQFHS